MTLGDLAETFLGSDFTTTTAALHVMAALTSDEVLSARIRRSLGERTQQIPAWLRGLDDTQVVSVVEMREAVRDGEDYFLDIRLPNGYSMTVLVYVDNNMGQVVKDAYVIPVPLAEVLDRLSGDLDEDTTVEPVDAADARARIERAVEHGQMLFPPLESDSWPLCRALVMWLVRMLPAGGTVPKAHEWTQDELDRIAEEFLASPFGTGYDDADHRGLLDALLWIGSSYDLCDPYRWTPVNIEILLLDRAPRKIVDKVAVLAKLPYVLAAFVRFAYAKRTLRASLLAEALAAIERWTPEYQRLIRDKGRPQGAEAIARMLLAADDRWEANDPLEAAVGGAEQLAALDSAPLPDEQFDWTGIPDDVRLKLTEILDLCDANADEFLDVEHRTANRRLLRAVTLADPAYFRGRAAARTSAAAICWMVAHANESISYYGDLTAKELMEPFGGGTPSQRAKLFRDRLGLPERFPSDGPMALGSADFLVSGRRFEIIEQRKL